jgi:hypothetical protein
MGNTNAKPEKREACLGLNHETVKKVTKSL